MEQKVILVHKDILESKDPLDQLEMTEYKDRKET